MTEDTTMQGYMGQGIRAPVWTIAGTGILGAAVAIGTAIYNAIKGGGGGQSKDAQIAELRAQNFTLANNGPVREAIAAQGSQLAYLQRTLDAVVKPMVPMPNIAGPAFPPPPYPYPPVTPPTVTGGTATAGGTQTNG